jgi:hypothetical protein
MRKLENNDAYYRARKHVECTRDFYIHLFFYLIVNILISSFKIINNLNDGEKFNEAFFDFSTVAIWLFWGIGLAIHVFKVFGLLFILGRNWEEEKMKEFMDEDINNRWD